ncbi:MAG: acyl--CoA ligase [Halioglobus sp.]|nr:acyl--CoA ligase [Halioglobus sp.]
MYAELAEVRAQLCEPGQPFEIEEVTVNGVQVKAWRNAAASLREVWLQAGGHGDADYLVYEDERLTYSQAQDRVARIARWMTDNGIAQHDRVAIALRNYPEWMLCYWASVSIGAVVVGINAWWVPEELAYALQDSAPRLLFADGERLQRFAGIKDSMPDMLAVGVRCDDSLGDVARPFSEVLKAEPELPEVTIHPDDDACIFYTSGTTGHPKGAQLTHRGCTNNILSAVYSNLTQQLALAKAGKTADNAAPGGKMNVLLTTPLFHVTANNVIAHTHTLLGNKLVHMYKWDAGEALRLIEREKINMLSGVPVMARELLAHPDYASTDTSSLAALGGGGAAVQPDLVEKIESRSAATAVSAFGMTEVCGLATGIIGAYFNDRPASVGPVLPIFDVRCVDADGRVVGVGETGEVQLKGAQVIKGYINRPDATADTIVHGWLHTGDIGYLDEDGFLYIVDRIKDMVLRGGENIYCAEVESVLFKHEDIAEVAVFSVPDDTLGEEVGAAIYPRDGARLDASALRAYCREHLAAYKIPRYLWVLDNPLPRNASGKFLKRSLQDTLNPEAAA